MAVCSVGLWNFRVEVNLLETAPGKWTLGALVSGIGMLGCLRELTDPNLVVARLTAIVAEEFLAAPGAQGCYILKLSEDVMFYWGWPCHILRGHA